VRENERIKRELQKCRDEDTIEYNSLVQEYNEAVDFYDTAQRKIEKLRAKNQDLNAKIENLQEEVADLEQERDGQMIRAKEKTQKIRNMVKERDDLQEKLAEVVEKAGEARASLNYEVKQRIAASTRLDKQLGDETFRKVMDQIYERFRECFLMVRRKQEFGQSGKFYCEKKRADAWYSRCQIHVVVRWVLDKIPVQTSAQLERQHFRRQTARLHLSRFQGLYSICQQPICLWPSQQGSNSGCLVGLGKPRR